MWVRTVQILVSDICLFQFPTLGSCFLYCEKIWMSYHLFCLSVIDGFQLLGKCFVCNLQVFVANPNKTSPIHEILVKNKEKLVEFLTSFHNDRTGIWQYIVQFQKIFNTLPTEKRIGISWGMRAGRGGRRGGGCKTEKSKEMSEA